MKPILFRILYFFQVHHLLRFFLRRKTVLLTYHGFTDQTHPGIENHHGKHVEIEKFRKQVQYLKKYYNVISLEQYLKGEGIPDNAVVITMDDGYRSNYTLAYPVLKEAGLPASIFLSTSFVEGREFLWTDRLDYAVNQKESGERIRHELKSVPQESRAQAVAEMESQSGKKLADETQIPAIYRPLEWNEVLEMQQNGLISFGSHTHTHVIVTKCGSEKMREELAFSKEIIEKRTGRPCPLFCYPNGGPGDFNQDSKKQLQDLGYECGLTTVEGFNDSKSDRYELKRLGVRNQVGIIEFMMTLSGIKKAFSDLKFLFLSLDPGLKTCRDDSARDVPSRIPELDGIRGLAILLVLIFHYVGTQISLGVSPVFDFLKNSLALTWSGVDLFFVLSGFLIGGILLDHKDSKNYFTAFYTRRVCRIFPLYFFIFALFAAFYSLRHLPFMTSVQWMFAEPMPLWSYAFFVQNFFMAVSGFFGAPFINPTWSLAVEEQFYLILPLMVRFVPARRIPFLILPLIALAPAARIFLFQHDPSSYVSSFVLLPDRMDCLFLGVLGAWMIRQPAILGFLKEKTHWLLLSLTALGFSMILLLKNASLGTFAITGPGLSLLAFFYFNLILLAVTAPKTFFIRKFLNQAFLRWLGMISYGVYMVHQIVAGFCHGFILKGPPQIMSLAGLSVSLFSLFLTLGIAYFSWRFFEMPILRLGHQVNYKK